MSASRTRQARQGIGREADVERIARLASGLVSHVFERNDLVARDATSALVRAFLAANAPCILDGQGGQGFDVALALPSAMGFRGGKFQGIVRGLVRIDKGSLREFRLPGTELGPTAIHAVKRTVTEASLGPLPRHPSRDRDAELFTLRPNHGLRGGRSVMPLAIAIGELAKDRIAHRSRMRFPADATLVTSQGEISIQVGSAENRAGHVIANGPPGPAGSRRGAAGSTLALPDGYEVDWTNYGMAVLQPLRPDLQSFIRGEVDAAHAAFRDRLDRSIVACLREQDDYSVVLYEWLEARGSVHARLNRRQALSTYPIIATLTGDAALAEAVDAERPLPDVLAIALKTSTAAAKRLVGVTKHRENGFRNLVSALPFASEVDPRHLPSRGSPEPIADQWQGLAEIVQGWQGIAATYNAQKLDLGIPRRLAAEAPAWQRVGGMARCHAIHETTYDFSDFSWWFGRHLLYPIAVDVLPPLPGSVARNLQHLASLPCEDGLSPIVIALIRDRCLSDLGRMSLDWHRRSGAIDASLKVGTPDEVLSWPALMAPFESHGFRVSALTTPEALAEEGEALEHCVGGYALQCLQSGHHILSVREDGRRVSTAEIRITTGDAAFEADLVQHKARDNAEPPRRARQAVAALVDAIRSGAVAVDFENLEAARKARIKAGDGDERIAGYDVHDISKRDQALALYAFTLPADERGLSHAEWADRLGLPDRMRELLRAELKVPSWTAHRGSYFLQSISAPEHADLRKAVEAHLAEDNPAPPGP